MPGFRSQLSITPAVARAALIAVILCCPAGAPAAVPASPPRPAPEASGQVLEREVKAAFLLKFANFVQWPEGTFSRDAQPLVIGVIGADDIADYLSRLTDQRGNGREVVVRRLDAEDAMNVQILYLGSGSAARPGELLQRIGHRPVLTVTSAPARTDAGVINFVIVNGRISFDIDLGAARRAGVRISARLLHIARIVYDDGEP